MEGVQKTTLTHNHNREALTTLKEYNDHSARRGSAYHRVCSLVTCSRIVIGRIVLCVSIKASKITARDAATSGMHDIAGHVLIANAARAELGIYHLQKFSQCVQQESWEIVLVAR